MNKKYWIIFSIIVLVMLVGGLIGKSVAYFSDTEKVSGNVVTVRTDWFDVHWKWRKQIVITNPATAITSAYPLKLRNVPFVTDHMNTDFSDVRFTSSNGTTALTYWIESYTASTSAIIWVNVPIIEASGTPTIIYMYYGNTSAATTGSESSVSSLFLNYQDFETSWTSNPNQNQSVPTGWTEISGTRGQLQYSSVTGQHNSHSMYINKDYTNNNIYGGNYAFAFPTQPYNIEFLSKPMQTNLVYNMMLSNNTNGANNTAGPRISFYSDSYLKYYTTNSGTINSFSPAYSYSTTNLYDIQFANVNTTADTYEVFVNDAQLLTSGGSSTFPFSNAITPTNQNFFFNTTTSLPKAYLDYIKVWRYVSYVIGTEE